MLNVLFLKQIANDKNLKFKINKNSIYDKEWKMTFKSEQKRKEFIDKIQKAEKQIENGEFYTEKEMEELLLEKYAIKL